MNQACEEMQQTCLAIREASSFCALKDGWDNWFHSGSINLQQRIWDKVTRNWVVNHLLLKR